MRAAKLSCSPVRAEQLVGFRAAVCVAGVLGADSPSHPHQRKFDISLDARCLLAAEYSEDRTCMAGNNTWREGPATACC